MTDDRSPRLVWSDDGAPRSGRFGDVYFSREDGLAESRAVFLNGCGLPGAWRGLRRFTVGELGFGTGLNIAALLDLWRRERPTDGRLQVFSVEAFPLSRAEAARALASWPEIADSARALLAAWPPATPGFRRIDLPDWQATIDLAIGDAAWALEQWQGRADAWFLDGFAPSANPDMWSDAVMDALARRSAPGARLATFTVAGQVRRGLAERGFRVDKRPGHGRKRERLEAFGPGEASEPPSPRVMIIGAGIAGASLARAVRALGGEPILIEADRPGAGGSGFPAALVTPRLDLGDAGVAALHAQALARAGDLYRTVPGAVLREGVLQLAQSPRDADRFPRLAAQALWPAGAMRVLDGDAAAVRAGEPVAGPALWMAQALAIAPARVLEAWLECIERITAPVGEIRRDEGGWRALDADGRSLARADVIVAAAAQDCARLIPDLPLAPVAGQADIAEGLDGSAAAWGGYCAPTETGVLFGATHDRGVERAETSAAASARNLATLAARLPLLAARVEAASRWSRAAVRATTLDRLPLAGAVATGLHVLTGLGSRGFALAPLLAEHVAATALGAASPLPVGLAAQVDPLRFAPSRPCASAPEGGR